MKKLLATIGLALMLLIPLTTGLALAKPPAAEPAKADEPQQPGQATAPKTQADNLLPKFTDPKGQGGIEEELKTYSSLTSASWTQIVASVIKTILFVAGALVMIGLLVVGAMTGSSNEENITKARKILIYLVIGIILISVSYAVVSGISQFNLGEL